jgi:hypothetical protein
MLETSRFNRRLHALAAFIYELQHQIGQIWREVTNETEYLLDSFPVSVCDNIRISRCRLLTGREY